MIRDHTAPIWPHARRAHPYVQKMRNLITWPLGALAAAALLWGVPAKPQTIHRQSRFPESTENRKLA